MRTSLALAIASVLFAFPAAAQKSTESAIRGSGRYGSAGCGLGSMVFGDSDGLIQLSAATTNGSSASQTFGITSGTSNCGPAVLAAGTKSFVDANREALAKDVSRGTGETIGAISWINGCKDATAVGAALQQNFKAIFPSESASTDDVTRAILQTLQQDEALGCEG